MSTRFSMALTALLALSLTAHGMVAETTLGKLATGSDLILVGKVARVVAVPAGDGEVRVAEVEVHRWVKGDPQPKRVWYLAEGTWTCDVSTAIEGEKALFFLTDPGGPVQGTDLGKDLCARLESPNFLKNLKVLMGEAPLLELAWSGHGRMPLAEIEGVVYADVDVRVVHLPADIPTIPGADPRYTWFVRFAPLDEVLGHVGHRLSPLGPPADENGATVFRLLELLDEDMDPEPSEKAEEIIDEIGAEAIPLLLGILDDPAFPRRDTAAEAIGWFDDEGAAALVRGLKAKSAARRRASAFAFEWCALNRILYQDEAFSAVLEAAKTNADTEVRARLVGALGRQEDDECVHRVIAALADESLLVRRSAARALFRLKWHLWVLEESHRFGAERALLPLTAHEDVAVRREAWEALQLVAGSASLPAVLRALDDADRVVRVTASLSLGRIGAAKATKRLILLLESEDPWARRAAAHALGVGKVAAGVGPLMRSLGDADADVVFIAIAALGEIGPAAAPAVPALEHLLETGDSDVGWHVKEALEKIRK